MCIQCANVNPSRPCNLQQLQVVSLYILILVICIHPYQERHGRKRKSENVNEEADPQGAGVSRLPWKEAIRQAALEYVHLSHNFYNFYFSHAGRTLSAT